MSKMFKMCRTFALRNENKRIKLDAVYRMIKFTIAFVFGKYKRCKKLYNYEIKCATISIRDSIIYSNQMNCYLYDSEFAKWKPTQQTRLALLKRNYKTGVQMEGIHYACGNCTSIIDNDKTVNGKAKFNQPLHTTWHSYDDTFALDEFNSTSDYIQLKQVTNRSLFQVTKNNRLQCTRYLFNRRTSYKELQNGVLYIKEGRFSIGNFTLNNTMIGNEIKLFINTSPRDATSVFINILNHNYLQKLARAIQIKHLQVIGGVKLVPCWFASLLTLIVVYIYDVTALIGENMIATFVLLVCFAFAAPPYTYCWSF